MGKLARCGDFEAAEKWLIRMVIEGVEAHVGRYYCFARSSDPWWRHARMVLGVQLALQNVEDIPGLCLKWCTSFIRHLVGTRSSNWQLEKLQGDFFFRNTFNFSYFFVSVIQS